MHYTWTSGNLDSFKSTHLYHKVASLKDLNLWIKDIDIQRNVMRILQTVTTHCLIEVRILIDLWNGSGTDFLVGAW
jgi:hypothetical protein